MTTKLANREEIAEGTMAFHFEKPPGWTFEAGQAIDISLLAPSETDAEGNTRTFTIASAPYEKSVMVATRMRDTAFKRMLKVMPVGTAVQMEGPAGDLTLHRDAARTAVFLSGGIGITPFRSIAFAAAKEHRPHRIFLFYSNRRPEDAAFLAELQALEKQNPNYKLIASMAGMEKSHRPWHGETGMINEQMLARYLKDASLPVYYIAGPPGMVKGLHTMIKESGVDERDIRTEEFSGY
jgi:ferredoxin-NADP reductase